jgi:hypothetical protein
MGRGLVETGGAAARPLALIASAPGRSFCRVCPGIRAGQPIIVVTFARYSRPNYHEEKNYHNNARPARTRHTPAKAPTSGDQRVPLN